MYLMLAAKQYENPDYAGCYNVGAHEANFLKLDCSKLKMTFGWKPVWNVERAMEKIIDWIFTYSKEEDVGVAMERQIDEFLSEEKISR